MSNKKKEKKELTLFQLLDLHKEFWDSVKSSLYGDVKISALDEMNHNILTVITEEGEMNGERKVFDEHGNLYITDKTVSKEPMLYLMLTQEQLKECVDELKEYSNFDEKYQDENVEANIFEDLGLFDFSTLKEFDPVLVRYNSGIWHTDFVDYVDSDEEGDLNIHLSFYAGSKNVEVAPYIEETKKFVGKYAVIPQGKIWTPKGFGSDSDDDYEYDGPS